MCEPHFSFVQILQGQQRNINNMLFGQEIRNSHLPALEIDTFLHYCSLGSGHTGANKKVNLQGGWRDFIKNDYECQWWDRVVRIDGYFKYPREQGFDLEIKNKEESLEAARIYANRVAIGNLSKLRHFLEVSLRKSSVPSKYASNFINILNKKGQDNYLKRLSQILGSTRGMFSSVNLPHWMAVNKNLDSTIKCMLGMTRRRQFLVPEWADDNKLWIVNK